MKRKTFLKTVAMGTAGVMINTTTNNEHMAKNLFVHHVYFWLKDPSSKEDRAKLIAGLEKLAKVKSIDMYHIGQPADTNRDVIERGYSISWFTLFKNKAAQDAYQVDPIHLKFVEECSNLWSKVVVYDSVDV